MASITEDVRNILVTDYQNSGEDVMIFTHSYTVEEVTATLRGKGEAFGEIYEVLERDLQYYLYEPCWLDKPVANVAV